jgi:peptidoglycan hydrolase CwlO-like protein
MKKLIPVFAMAVALGLALGVDANAINQDKLEKKLEKLQDKLENAQNPTKIERLQNKIERIETRLEKQGAATISNPEPSSILLLGTGMAAFGFWRWHTRRR